MRINQIMAGSYEQNSRKNSDLRKKRGFAILRHNNDNAAADVVNISPAGFDLEQHESEKDLVRNYLRENSDVLQRQERIRSIVEKKKYDYALALESILERPEDLI